MNSVDYKVPWLAKKLFHELPRLDLTFAPMNASFQPNLQSYRESLIIWAAVPVLWLVLTLLVFLMYFCYRCCQRDVEKKQRVPCLRWTMAILALLTCGVIGVGFYGNEEVRKGVTAFANAAADADATNSKMEQQVKYFQRTMDETVEEGKSRIAAVFKEQLEEMEDNKKPSTSLDRQLAKWDENSRLVHRAVADIDALATRLDLASLLGHTRTVGFYLWLGVVVMLACFILLCLNLLLGIGRSSKCILLLFCALGIICLVICWIAAGIFFGMSVGLSDFCVAPDRFVLQELTRPKKQPLPRDAEQAFDDYVARYYIKCNVGKEPNPFRGYFQSAHDHLRLCNSSFTKARNIFKDVLTNEQLEPHLTQLLNGLDEMQETLMHLTALIECTNLHKDYTAALNSICHTALVGNTFVLLSSIVTGLLLTLLVLMASRAWRHFTRSQYVERQEGGSKGYQEVEEDDPFLPRPDPNSPSYYSFTRQGPRGNPRNAGEQITMQRRNTPPPASPDYNSYGYNHSNASPSPEDNHIPDFGSDSQA